MSHQEQVFNLVQFDREITHPLSIAFSEALSEHMTRLRFSEMAVSYFWLDLGIEVGYFPASEATSLVGQRFNLFFQDLRDRFIHFGYLLDPVFSVLLSRGFLSTGFGDEHKVDPVDPSPAAYDCFRAAVTIEAPCVANERAELFMALLNFAPHLLTDVLERDHAIKLHPRELTLTRDSIVEGFAATVQFMESLRILSTQILTDPDIPEEKRPGLERRIRRLTRWRVSRFRNQIDDDFMKVAKFVVERSDLPWDQVRVSVKRLLDEWGFSHERTVNQSSSGWF